MKKIILLLFAFIIHNNYGQSNRDIYFLENSYKTFLPIIKKEGKKAKLRETVIKFYTIILRDKAIGNFYSRGAIRPQKYTRYVAFTKYIEEYKEKRIREVLFETKPTSRVVSKKDLTVTQKINLFNSTTEINTDIRCQIDERYMYVNRENIPAFLLDLKFPRKLSLVSRKFLKISQKNINHIYELIGNDNYLIEALKRKQITENGITDLIELKHYIEKTYSDKFKYKIENKKLKKELGTLIPGISDFNDYQPSLGINSFVNENNVRFNLIEENFHWEPILGRNKSNELTHLVIEYPKENKFAGNVYLKMLNRGTWSDPILVEVYHSTTKNKVPYNKLVLYTGTSGKLKIYGLNGSYNLTNYYFEVPDNEYLDSDIKTRSDFLDLSIMEFIPVDYQSKLGSIKDIVIAKELPKKGSLIEKYNEDKIKNYYLKWAIKSRPAFINRYIEALKQRDLGDTRRSVEYINNERKISMDKNGFYLNNALIVDGKIKERIGSKLVRLFTGKSSYYEEDIIKVGLLNEFMRAKAKKCPSDLTQEEKTPIYDVGDCVEWLENVRNGNTRCTKWNKKPSGLYTSKDLFNAYLKVGARVKSLKGILNTMVEMGKNKKRTSILNTIEKNKKDIQLMFELNTCGKAIERFEKNLIKSVNGEQLIKLN